MPGLVGLITKMPRQRAEVELLRMLATLKHESFYVSGTWIDESLGLYRLGCKAGLFRRENAFAKRAWRFGARVLR